MKIKKSFTVGISSVVASSLLIVSSPAAFAAETQTTEQGIQQQAPSSISDAQLLQHTTSAEDPQASAAALPALTLPVVLACVGTVGLSTYQAYKGGDPVEYVTSAIIGCIPFGAGARPVVVKLITQNKGAIANALRAVGATSLAAALTGDSAQ